MSVHALRGLIVAALLTGCREPSVDEALALGRDYVDDAAFRRDELEASLVSHENGYARLRLEHYARDWDELAEWNPPVRPFREDDLGRFVERGYAASEGELERVVDDPRDVAWDRETLLALGRRAFERYPLEIDMPILAVTGSREIAAQYGLELDDRGELSGLVRVRLDDGREALAITCATCHSRVARDGSREHGPANARLDRGAIAGDALSRIGGDEGVLRELYGWGPGRIDVTGDGVSNPTAIPDLRAVRFQSHLHATGSVRQSLVALAIRIETLIVTSLDRARRPPREIAFAIAYYLYSLGEDPLPDAPGSDGGALFARECASCHHEDGRAAPPIPIAAAGTDPRVGESPERGTGSYRIPSLYRVSTRTPLLHDASAATLDALLDPDRESPGHRFGSMLTVNDRAALLAFVRARFP